tara:strand:+ start:5711 stop:5998 length:288 start_codon:yes stop_codon:yes gene_type:complete
MVVFIIELENNIEKNYDIENQIINLVKYKYNNFTIVKHLKFEKNIVNSIYYEIRCEEVPNSDCHAATYDMLRLRFINIKCDIYIKNNTNSDSLLV